MHKLLNLKYNKYLAYLPTPTAAGTYTVLLLDKGDSLRAHFVWEKVSVPTEDHGFTLRAPEIKDASLVMLGGLANAFAWVATADYADPVKMLWDDTIGDIPLDTGPEYLCASDADPYAYFRPFVNDPWEFQPV